MEFKYHVSGMHCAACSAAVERILKKQEGIETAQVNLVMEEVLIQAEEENFDAWKEAVSKGGFELEKLQDKKDVSYHKKVVCDILGMQCAACSAGIEKVLKRTEGILDVSVNLLLNQAEIEYDQTKIKLEEIFQVIQKGGFDARIHQEQQQEETKKKDYENVHIYGTLIVAFLLLYIGMSHMLGSFELPLPNIISYKTNPFNFAFIQFVLATIIAISGWKFYYRGIRSLLHGAANMDTLVAIGTGSAYIYSVFSLFSIANGNVHAVHSLYFEGAGVVIALVQFGKHLEAISKKKSTGAIQALLQLRPKTATLFKNGKEMEISVDEVVVGDVLVVKAGEHIAVDGIVVEGESNVDESMLSGESMPVKKGVQDEVHQGTMNLDGRLLMRCSVDNEDTTLSKIIRMVEDAQSKKAPIARIADRISMYFVPIVMGIAFVSALIWYFIQKDVSFSLTIFVSVLVIACPCALGLATPTAIMVGTGKAAQLGIFIKSGEALEIASHIDCVVFDKTGTITIGKPLVTDVFAQDKQQVLAYAAALEQGSVHPLATAILQKAEEEHILAPSLSNIQTVNGKGVYAQLSEKKLMAGNRRMMEEEGLDVSMYLEAEKACQEAGKSVVWVSYDQQVIGMLAIADKIKDHVRDVVESLTKSGKEVYMISGDHTRTATAIAKQAGITNVIAEVLPQDKAEEVKRLQKLGKKVAMVGDGINDAIALTQSEVGIAIGSGSDVAIESADIVLMKEDIRDVETALRLSHSVLRNIKQNLFWAFFYNTIGIPVAAGILYPIFHILLSPVFAGAAMAFSSVSVVSNALRLRNFK
ncbi:heavy metal translocating P-type ATPase [Amedibacterium intestinale]|uniref:P-type Cu(+) transporter n=1 Tax=Amedibacterium intestinale TaxID=2583452 RepID=A0A6N4TLN3_9FIRM|nr:heavy metal translocating P-type ATPase [Amedibacterium intestinale]RHO30497.1 Cu(2+)-exporting ATPase [Erysipelotrichaceae bacterium AM17-60]BBK23728.1 copper-translocating P-type ATPase [Amedibacterium intestinale]BBK63424.1 copper-translocating P-type ATPase [Amedibacterium intestinale]